ncbi:MAG: hypothetical protein ACI4PO_00940 [Faecousia sp.]
MSGCSHCGGDCGSCSGCAGTLVLTEGEISLLRLLGQIPFLPVARKCDDTTPIFLEDFDFGADSSLILQCLEKKGLISLDYDQPIGSYDHPGYTSFPVHGSMALTRRGQAVLDLLEIQGIDCSDK